MPSDAWSISFRQKPATGSEKKGTLTYIYALAPLAELPGYVTRVRSISQGRASPYIEPSHYEEVPVNITESIVDKDKSQDKKIRA